MRMVEPSAASWLRGGSPGATPGLLEPWGRAEGAFPRLLADLHAVDVVVGFAMIEVARAIAGASAMAAAIDAEADAGAGCSMSAVAKAFARG